MCILICECWPIQSVNKTQCPIHFWSSEVQLKTNLISGCSRRVCYYTNWSQYSPGYGRFVPENVSPFLCTHVVYAFAKLRLRKPSGGLWVEWQEHRLVQEHVSRHQKLLLLLWRSPAEHCGGHPFSSDIMAVKGLRSNPHRLHRCHHQHHLALIS